MTGADDDVLATAVRGLFAGEAAAQPGDEARASRLAQAAMQAVAADSDPLRAQVADAFASESRAQPGDERIIARMVDGAMIAAAPPRPRRRVLRASPVLLGVLVSSGVLAAGAVVTTVVRAPRAVTAPQMPKTPPSPRPQPVVQPLEAPPPTAPEVSAPAPKPSAATMFERANAFRRAGKLQAAAHAYDVLITAHPRSSEAQLSRLSLADVHEARGHRDEALAQLDSYLRLGHDGALVEEALLRKARLLQATGKAEGARRTWQTLRDRFPASVYRAEADAQLAKLRRR